MRNKKLSNTRKISVSLLSILFCVLSFSKVFSADINISSIEDWNGGSLSGTRPVSSGVGIELETGGSWGALTWKTPDKVLSVGAAFTSDGSNIYVVRGLGDVLFWKYRAESDSWVTLENLPRGAYFGSDIQYLNGYIYALFGGYQQTFARYSVVEDSWEMLPNYPDLVFQGASMTTDGTNIYAITGNSTQNFYKYTVATNSWSILASTPNTLRSGADLERVGDYIYTPRGLNTNTFYAYSLVSKTWSTLSNIPGNVNDDVDITSANGNIYLAAQNNTTLFYKYNISSGSWSTLVNAPLTSRYAGVQYLSSDGYIYFFRGNGDYRFWKFDITLEEFIGPSEAPSTLSTGSDGIFYNNYIYFLRGTNTATFYRYDVSNNLWTTLPDSPVTFNDYTNGVLANGYIYFLTGSGTASFVRYNISGAVWESLANSPAITRYGAALAYPGTGNYLYVTQGANTSAFWRYDFVSNTWDQTVSNLPTAVIASYGTTLLSDGTDIYFTGGIGVKRMFKYVISSDTWTELSALPYSPLYGTDAVYDGNGKIVAIAGNYKSDLWEYNISTDTWKRLGSYAPYNPTNIGSWTGASIVSNELGDIFITRGGGRLDMLIYSYGLSDYKSFGTWISQIQDLKYVSSWGQMSLNGNYPSDSDVLVETRTSVDSITWSSWEEVVSNEIASPTNRYLQIKITLLSSTDGSETPVVDSIGFSYVSDINPPSNPINVVALSQEIGGTQLTSEEKYVYTNPSFTWEEGDDLETSVSGYYVYFGSVINANPVELGSFQTDLTYTVHKGLSTGLNYLRLVTEDILGNRSEPVTLFIYDYDGVAPVISLDIGHDNFVGTFNDVQLTDESIKLDNVSGGFWLQNRLTYAPVSLGYASKGSVYIESLGKIYVPLGVNSNRVFEYDISTDSWSELSSAPGAFYYGGGMVEGPDGYLYGVMGGNTTNFWRYNIGSNSWYSDVSSLPLTIGYGSSVVYDGSEYIYVLRGNNADFFWRYDTASDVWESLERPDFGAPQTQINNNVYMGGSMAIDITNQLIYVTQGNYSSAFSVYNINTNQWSVLGELPALAYLGASITYYQASNSLYYMPGNGTPYMYKYSLDTQEWTQLQSAPSGFNYGSGLYPVGEYLYAIRGGSSNLFYKYHIESDSWEIPTRGLFEREYEGVSTFNMNYGADILKGDDNNFYITRGNYGDEFVRWNEVTGEITHLSSLPIGAYLGSSIVYDSVQNKIYLTGGIYYNGFFVYDIDTNTWIEETQDQTPVVTNSGSSMVYDGSRYIYLSIGGNTNTFYRFDTQGVSGSKWSTLTNVTSTLYYGSELLFKDGEIYTLRGASANPNPFYKYTIQSDTWSSLTSLNANIYNDGFLVDGNDGNFYAARGANTSEFYKYSLVSESWSTLPNFPGQIYAGGAGESNLENSIYVLAGSGTNTYQDAVYTYIQETNSSGFLREGVYESQIHDLTSVYKWGNLKVNYQDVENTQLIIETSSSQDSLEWSDWASVSREKKSNSMFEYKINSVVGRYLKIRFSFSTGDGIYTPTLLGYTIDYYQDILEPTNPSLSGFISLNQDGGEIALMTNNWYGYQSPYFEWEEVGEEFGANDGINGSGVVGYNVYWGTNSSADPAQDGVFQEGNSFVPSTLEDSSTYYLRIRTVDDAGNYSVETWQPFIYKYDVSAPVVVDNLSVDPAGYTANNSFSFDWDPTSTVGAPVVSYCYRTGAVSGSYSVDQCIEETSVEDVPSYKVGTNVFKVRAKDAAGNYSEYLNGYYFYVDSANAPAPPTNLTVTPTSSTTNSFGFKWDPPLEGTYYGSQSNLSYLYSINALPTEYSVSQTSLRSLNAGAYATLPGENIFYIVSKDEAGNVNYGDYTSVSFYANTIAPGIPLNIEIADVSVKSTSSWRLAVSWDPPDNEGSGVAGYEVYRSTNGNNFSKHSFTSGASLVDSKLNQTTYYYKIRACDSTNNCGAFSEIVSLYPDGRYIEPAPLLVTPIVSDVTPKKATVSWVTSRTADSRVAYGTESGVYFEEEVSNSEQVADHILTINNLTPGTKYFYVVKWTDEDGNIGISEEDAFTTSPPPSIQEPIVKRVSLNSALIEFTTKGAIKVRVLYGETSSFGGMVEVFTGTQEGTHSVELNDIKDGTKYFYKINTFDIDGSEYEGEMHSFETLPRPKIIDSKVYQVSGAAYTTLLVEWVSNTAISSVVTYFPSSSPEQALDEVNVALKAGKHRAVILNLLPNTQYSIIISGKDFIGNEANSGIINFTTAVDTRPPQIYDLEVSSEIIGSGDEASAQLVVSYKTDEPTSAQIEYGEGTGSTYSQKSQEDTILSNNHIVIISGLTPSKVYHLRAVSKDEEGNLGYSIDKVIVSSSSSENAFDLAIDNLISIFSFLGKK